MFLKYAIQIKAVQIEHKIPTYFFGVRGPASLYTVYDNATGEQIVSDRNYTSHFPYTFLYIYIYIYMCVFYYSTLPSYRYHYITTTPVDYQLITSIFQSPMWPTNHQFWEILLWIYLQFYKFHTLYILSNNILQYFCIF
jgi:hypothetical protein